MVETKYFPVLSFKTGIWYRLFVIYFYSLLIIGFYHIINKVRTAPSIYRKQNYTVLLAALMPWLTNLLYLGGIKPLHFIDLTPFAFSATSILIFYSVYRFKLFDIVPIARQKLFSLMDDGILVLDSDYHIIDSNFTVRKFLPIGRSKHNKPLDLEMIEHAFPHLLEQLQINEPTVKEYCVKNDFETTYTEISSRLFEDDETKKQIFIVRFRDITTIKAEAIETELQREKLAKLDQLKTRIFSIISHDLRGPLVNLTEVLKMLAENELSDEEFKYLTPNIKKDINYTVNLLENLLHWSRSQIAGKGEKNEFINFTTLAKGEIRRQQTAADQKGVALKLELKPSISVFADYTMLQIVLRNLISNAIKFCNMKNTVQVVAEEDEDWVIVKVIDSGVGMDGKSLERLFSNEDFSLRGTNNERGTGLGVLICKEFMHKMNGKITVTSELGIGTQFQLWLPKHKNVSARYQQTE
jgi:signal transduction histidine kinase